MIEQYQRDFIEFLIANDALRFGSFTLKSGRHSPYFINTGQFNSGQAINRLSSYYAAAMTDHHLDDCSIVFGPAYKGIPLCVAIAGYFARQAGSSMAYLFDRKEAKDHGEFSGQELQKQFFVGRIPERDDRLVLVDDVMTTGSTKYEAVDLLRRLGDHVVIKGLVISVDRQERDAAGKDPIHEFSSQTGIPVFSIIALSHVIVWLEEHRDTHGAHLDEILEYRKQWGIENR